MQESNLGSTFVLTLLLLVGLFFFLRASVKDRTERAQFPFALRADIVESNLRQYLERRSYRLVSEDDGLVFSGTVAPSRFLAIFLTLLAFLGLVCLGLVLATLLPSAGWIAVALPLLSPGIGMYYWKGAKRPEQVVARISNTSDGSTLLIQAHRDEILTLRETLKVKSD